MFFAPRLGGAVLTEFADADIIYYYTGNNIRVEAEPAIAGCRKIPGYIAVRIFDLTARHPNPLNSRLRATMPPGPLASAVARQANSAAGGERSPHSQHDAKVADIAATAARIARPVQAGRPWAQCGNIDPLRPPAAPSVNISFCVLAFGQSP